MPIVLHLITLFDKNLVFMYCNLFCNQILRGGLKTKNLDNTLIIKVLFSRDDRI